MPKVGRPSPSMVVALIALVVALGGTGYAAVALAPNSVGSPQIKPGAVKTQDLGRRAVTSSRIRNGAVNRSKLAANSVDGAKILDGSVGEADLGAGLLGRPAPPTGAAGGDLAGSYPNPSIRGGSVSAAAIGTLPGGRLVRNADFSVPTGAGFTPVPFDTESFDTGGLFDPGAPTRLTVPIAGVYALTGGARWAANATGVRSTFLRKNGASGAGFLAGGTVPDNGAEEARQSVATVARLQAGDFVELQVQQNTGGALNLTAASTELTHLSAMWLGP